MRSTDLRKLKDFTRHVEGMRAAWAADFVRCDCALTDGRWETASRCRGIRPSGPVPCRTATATSCRVMLASLGLPHEHLDDTELEVAIEELHSTVLVAARLSVDDFRVRTVEALRVEEAAALAGWTAGA